MGRGRAGCQRSPGHGARRVVYSSAVSPVANRTCRLNRFGVAPMSEVTRILSAIEQGDPSAPGELLPLVYDELRKLAAARMASEPAGQTLQPTALVHEAYLRLVGGEERAWDSRGHFFAAAAEAMRRIVVETARRKKRAKHGGGRERVEVELADLPTRLPPDDLLALDEALGL